MGQGLGKKYKSIKIKVIFAQLLRTELHCELGSKQLYSHTQNMCCLSVSIVGGALVLFMEGAEFLKLEFYICEHDLYKHSV